MRVEEDFDDIFSEISSCIYRDWRNSRSRYSTLPSNLYIAVLVYHRVLLENDQKRLDMVGEWIVDYIDEA